MLVQLRGIDLLTESCVGYSAPAALHWAHSILLIGAAGNDSLFTRPQSLCAVSLFLSDPQPVVFSCIVTPSIVVVMCCSAITCAKCCTIYSIAGVVFLIIVGAMVERQPLYIEGLDDSDKGSKACYYGALLYVVSCLLSVGYWIYHTKTQTRSFGLSQENLGNKYGSIGN